MADPKDRAALVAASEAGGGRHSGHSLRQPTDTRDGDDSRPLAGPSGQALQAAPANV
jgi:hypothetical protein